MIGTPRGEHELWLLLPGSGVIVDPRGLVLTHAQLFQEENDRASVRLADGRTFSAQLLARDGPERVALLALELPEGTHLPAAILADSTASIAGEFAAVVGRGGFSSER